MFKKALQLKLRFDTAKGQLTVEDLFDLPLTSESKVSLNGIAISVNRELQASQEKSFVDTKSSGNATLELGLEILKEVIADRIEHNEIERTAAGRKQNKEKLMSILADKQDEDLKGKSAAEIQGMIDAL